MSARALLAAASIGVVVAVVGGSLGGHQVLCWATRYPDYVKTAVVIAASARVTAQAIAFDVVGRNAIQSDPQFHGGQYYGTGEYPGMRVDCLLAEEVFPVVIANQRDHGRVSVQGTDDVPHANEPDSANEHGIARPGLIARSIRRASRSQPGRGRCRGPAP